MFRVLATALSITAFSLMSHAADQREVRQLIATLKESADPATARRGGKDRMLSISLAADGANPSSIIMYYGPLFEKHMIRQAEMDFKASSQKMLPVRPTFAVFIPAMMCVLYLIDEKSNGIVTHSGQQCSSWGGWIGQNDGDAKEFFKQLGGPQKTYDAIIATALKQLKK